MWYIGHTTRWTSSQRIGVSATNSRIIANISRGKRRTAPFGLPVVPEVYVTTDAPSSSPSIACFCDERRSSYREEPGTSPPIATKRSFGKSIFSRACSIVAASS